MPVKSTHSQLNPVHIFQKNPSKIITLKNDAWNLHCPHMCYNALQILFISSIYNFLHAYYVLRPARSSKYD